MNSGFLTLVIATLLLCLGPGCASKRLTVVPLDREQVFMQGQYIHRVKVVSKSGKKFTFTGLITLKESVVQVKGLTPMNTTLFQIVEDRKSGEITTVAYHELIQNRKDLIEDVYSVLRPLLLLKRAGAGDKGIEWIKADPDGYPRKIQIRNEGRVIEMEFELYDRNRVPKTIVLKHPKFTVHIEVDEYEL